MTTIKTEIVPTKMGYEVWYSLNDGNLQLDTVHPTMDEAVRFTASLKAHYSFYNQITKGLKSKSGE